MTTTFLDSTIKFRDECLEHDEDPEIQLPDFLRPLIEREVKLSEYYVGNLELLDVPISEIVSNEISFAGVLFKFHSVEAACMIEEVEEGILEAVEKELEQLKQKTNKLDRRCYIEPDPFNPGKVICFAPGGLPMGKVVCKELYDALKVGE